MNQLIESIYEAYRRAMSFNPSLINTIILSEEDKYTLYGLDPHSNMGMHVEPDGKLKVFGCTIIGNPNFKKGQIKVGFLV